MMVGADMTVAITRTEHSAADLRCQPGQSGDADEARRLLALALVLDGRKRADAAQLAGRLRRRSGFQLTKRLERSKAAPPVTRRRPRIQSVARTVI